jgi:hypothetical protein
VSHNEYEYDWIDSEIDDAKYSDDNMKMKK